MNNLREAFKENANLIGLAVTAATSAVLLNPVPLFIGLVAEAAYLLTVPDSNWYTRLLKVRGAIAAKKVRDAAKTEALPELCPGTRERFLRLEKLCDQIASDTEEQHWFAEAPEKFNLLLDKFLAFAIKEAQFSQYLASVHEEVCGMRPRFLAKRPTPQPLARQTHVYGPHAASQEPEPPLDTDDSWVQQAIANIRAKYTEELGNLNGLLAKEQDDSTRAVLAKRIEILQRREEYLTKIEKALTNLTHQLQLLEDTFGLINDEISTRSPEQVLEDIDDVLTQTDSMARILDELAPYEQAISRLKQSA